MTNTVTKERVLWIASETLLGAGLLVYLVTNASRAWWLTTPAAVPFAWMVVQRANRKGFEPDRGDFDGPFGDGPWGPP